MKKETYSVVVESGSCSPDRKRWEERTNCGHAHRTMEAAEKCKARLTRMYCQHGRIAGTPCHHCLGYAQAQNCSATWYNATIHNQDGERPGVADTLLDQQYYALTGMDREQAIKSGYKL